CQRIELRIRRRSEPARPWIQPERFSEHERNAAAAVAHGAKTRQRLLQTFGGSALIGGALLGSAARVFSLLLAFDSRQPYFGIFGFGAHALHFIAQPRNFSARVAQLLGR